MTATEVETHCVALGHGNTGTKDLRSMAASYGHSWFTQSAFLAVMCASRDPEHGLRRAELDEKMYSVSSRTGVGVANQQFEFGDHMLLSFLPLPIVVPFHITGE